MIDVSMQVAGIEKLMELMTKHEIDELSCDFINIKKTRHRGHVVVLDEKALLEKHIAPQTDNEPWLAQVSQAEADAWSANGGR